MKKYNYRKYYKPGERLELNGKVIEVAENSCACGNCCFMNEFFNVLCSSGCAGDERPDGLSVCFRPVDTADDNAREYPPHDPGKEYAIYGRFQYNGAVAGCRECSSPRQCRDCALYPYMCGFNKCRAFSREDGIGVYYKILDDVRP